MQTEKSSVRVTICGLIGGILVVVAAILVVPQIIDAISSYAYKKQKRNTSEIDDDDWGPEIVKKNKETEEEVDGI